MNWVQLSGSIIAILVLAGIAAALKLGDVSPMAAPEEAAAIAESNLSGFTADAAWLSLDRNHAIVKGADGGVALIRPHGAHYICCRTRSVQAKQTDTQQFGGRVEIGCDDPRWGVVALDFASRHEANEVMQALAPQLTSV